MKCWAVILLFLLVTNVMGQDVLLNQKTEDVLQDKADFGPNKKKYNHNFFGVGFAVPTRQDHETLIYGGSSFGIDYGWRVKRKLSNAFSVGYDVSGGYMQYRSRKDTSSVYSQVYGTPAPDTLTTDKISYSSIKLKPYFRINFGQRGNHLGKYIDLAFYGELMLSSTHVAKFNHPNDEVIGKSQFKTRQLKYTNKLFYGPEFRYGNAFYNIYLRYRMPDFFNSKIAINPFELPAITAGIYLILPK